MSPGASAGCLVILLFGMLLFTRSANATQIELKTTADHIEFTFENAARRPVLERLLQGLGTKLTWLDESYATESISGRMEGTFNEVVLRFLRSGNFVIIYNEEGERRRISEIILIGPQPDGSLSPSYGAMAKALGPSPPGKTLTAEEKLGLVSREEINQIAISAADHARRLGEQNLWGVNAVNAHVDQLQRMAAQGLDLPALRGVGDTSAGYPPYYLEPESHDPDRYSKLSAALTQMMALRSLNALKEAVQSFSLAAPSVAGPEAAPKR